jgi:hypothetical protein
MAIGIPILLLALVPSVLLWRLERNGRVQLVRIRRIALVGVIVTITMTKIIEHLR